MVYLDTSALVKRYLQEPKSDAFDDYFTAAAPCAISRLSFVEMRCALARRRRNREISPTLEKEALEQLRLDVQDGAVVIHPVGDGQMAEAYHLIDRLESIPLRTLDALHLAIAGDIAATAFATADRAQADAAAALGFTVHTFF